MAALSQRDRRALLACVGALLLLGLVQLVLLPLLDGRKRLAQGISSKEEGLVEMQAIQAEIGQLSQQSSTLAQRVAQRSEAFGLFAFIEEKGEQAKVKENILYMKPADSVGEGDLQQVAVEMKLQAVRLSDLVVLLELVESPENIVEVERVSIVTNKKDLGTLDAILRVVSLVRAKDGG